MSWARRSLTARALAISAVFAVLLAAGFTVLVVAIESLRDAGRAAVRAQRAVTVGTELEKSVVNLENGLRAYVASGREDLLDPFQSARRQYPDQIRRLQALARDDPRLRTEVMRISTEISDYVELWALPLLGVARDDLEVARSVIVNTEGRMRVQAIRAAFRTMFDRARDEAQAKERGAEGRAELAVTMGMGGIVLVVALSGLLGWALRRGIVRPLSRLALATGDVAHGDLTARVPAERTDELGDLARAFNAMAESLERSREELAHRAHELERSNRELEDYASVTSHDLQGPLVTIGMYSELLAQRLGDDPEARELVVHIRDGAAGMRRLVRELLAYARLERHAGRKERVPLDDSLREALDNLAGPIQDAAASVQAAALPVVTGDPARLTQLLQNLLTNALKFTEDASPRVEVSSTLDDGMARVSVRDHGIGFAPGETDVIFRPFQRLHGADRFEGTGIGLAVCQKIVDQHGGRIWAEGRPGEGATFHFTIPLAEPSVDDDDRTTEPVGATRLR